MTDFLRRIYSCVCCSKLLGSTEQQIWGFTYGVIKLLVLIIHG